MAASGVGGSLRRAISEIFLAPGASIEVALGGEAEGCAFIMYDVESGVVCLIDDTPSRAQDAQVHPTTYTLEPRAPPFLYHPADQLHALRCVSAVPAVVRYALIPRDCVGAAAPICSSPLAPSSDAELGLRKATLQKYVDALRQDLRDLSQDTNGLSQQEYEAIMALHARESDGRWGIVATWLVSLEQRQRQVHCAREEEEFDVLKRARREALLVPWCSFSCNYCCSTRHVWAEHVERTHRVLNDELALSESKLRIHMADREAGARERIRELRTAITEISTARSAALRAVQAEEEHLRASLSLCERCEFGEFLVAWGEIERNKRLLVQSGELRERYLAVVRVQDGLQLQERRVLRRLQVLLNEEERSARQHLTDMQEGRFVDVNNRFYRGRDEILFSEWKRGVEHVLRERDELADFRTKVEQDKVAAEAAAARAVQEALVAEFKEVKMMKKAGPPKNPELPPCARCGQVPAKDLFTHRTAECPVRPVQCAKCEAIMPLTTQEAHKLTCPSRILQCDGCGNHFKASYLEMVHSTRCGHIKDVRDQLAQLNPAFPFQLASNALTGADRKNRGTQAQATAVNAAVVVRFDSCDSSPALQAVSSAFAPDMWVNSHADTWTLVALSPVSPGSAATGAPPEHTVVSVREPNDVKLFLAANADTVLRIGEPISALLEPTAVRAPASAATSREGTPPPLAAAAAAAAAAPTAATTAASTEQGMVGGAAGGVVGGADPSAHRQWVTIPIITTIPMAEFREMQFTISADEANYCKPQPVPAGRKGAKK